VRILAVNAGSTSLKLSLVGEAGATRAERDATDTDVAAWPHAVLRFLRDSGGADAVCIRLVHGGPRLREAVVVDDSVRVELDTAAAMAPLHVPPVLGLLDALRSELSTPCVACFDTAFHALMPEAAAIYAVPERWRSDLGVRRYGFHGLSCEWSLHVAAQHLQRDPASLQLVVAHLGGGCSVTAVRDAHGVDTTMGFSPLDGLMMATRSGSVDPAAVLWLQTAHGMQAAEVSAALEHESGLLAIAGTADMRQVLSNAKRGDAGAVLAVDTFVHRARAGVGAMLMSLDRLDALVFTGGIGEHAAELRERIGAGCVDSGRILVVHAREDLQMAAQAEALLSPR
jgi:acetate kinase